MGLYLNRNWDWGKRNKITYVMAKVNAARKAHAAFHHMHNLEFCKIENEQLIAYCKQDAAAGDNLLMVVNLDPHYTQSGWVQVPLQKIGLRPGQQFHAHDLLTGNTYNWDQEWNFVELNPHALPFHLFQLKPSAYHGKSENNPNLEQLPGRRPIAEALGG
jgi:starch synthase (maltosyl-transferring)